MPKRKATGTVVVSSFETFPPSRGFSRFIRALQREKGAKKADGFKPSAFAVLPFTRRRTFFC
ncbi:hypothetical protein SRRS_33730 [Sporomusa rhizae]